MILDCGGQRLDLSVPRVMGILNVTPDSFSDGGRFRGLDAAVRHAREMWEEGAAIIDVGGESTRPGAEPVGWQEELDRVIPVIEAVRREIPAVVSIDTSKPEVMREAARAGAGLINDVYALRLEGAVDAAAASGLPVCLMHMQGEPRSMQISPGYTDVVQEIREFLQGRIALAQAAGIPRDRILIDPGFGFGKLLSHNLTLLKRLAELTALGVPILAGLSRKSAIGAVLDAPVERRLHGSVAAAVLAVWQGAAIIRAHDVGPTVQALKVVAAVRPA